jgi:hypothetical protein
VVKLTRIKTDIGVVKLTRTKTDIGVVKLTRTKTDIGVVKLTRTKTEAKEVSKAVLSLSAHLSQRPVRADEFSALI